MCIHRRPWVVRFLLLPLLLPLLHLHRFRNLHPLRLPLHLHPVQNLYPFHRLVRLRRLRRLHLRRCLVPNNLRVLQRLCVLHPPSLFSTTL
jgi:hypothetical protein